MYTTTARQFFQVNHGEQPNAEGLSGWKAFKTIRIIKVRIICPIQIILAQRTSSRFVGSIWTCRIKEKWFRYIHKGSSRRRLLPATRCFVEFEKSIGLNIQLFGMKEVRNQRKALNKRKMWRFISMEFVWTRPRSRKVPNAHSKRKILVERSISYHQKGSQI